jgi:chromosome partitioning protein
VAQIISVLGNKGGTGKTTISHMLGHGLGLLGLPAVVAVTDVTREPLSRVGRRYLPVDARRPEQLAKVASTLQGLAGWIGVIDGGGGRVDFDDDLARLSTVVLLPFRDSHEDIRTVRRDLERLPTAYALPSQWATNALAREAASRSLEALLADFRDRIIPPVMAFAATKVLLQLELPSALPSGLNGVCRGLARHAALLAGITVPDEGPISKQTQSDPTLHDSAPAAERPSVAHVA